MASQTFEQLIKDIQKKVFRPVYFFMGEEPFFIDVLSENIENYALNENENEFNLTILYGRDNDIISVLTAARRYPMMADYHLVVVREAQSLKNLNTKGKEEKFQDKTTGAKPIPSPKTSLKTKPKIQEDFDLLLKYLENPLKTTILVFCYKYKTIALKSRLGQAIDKNGVFFESKRISDYKLPSWIEEYVIKKGYSITPKATQIVSDHLGNDLSKVINELQKLFILFPKGTEITPAIIEENIGISKDFNIFELQTALGSMDREKVYRITNYFGNNHKANPLVLTLSMLFLYFQKLMIYHFTPDKSPASLETALGLKPYFQKDYAAAAKHYTPERLEKIFTYLRECDLKLKGVGQRDPQPGELLKELVFKIMQ
ncbi:MAG TPA: DNA polymerase III subunit delta [Bacteroidales bacterium]|nr:DNA polymerase III subunit delta [Bacteroidales bacterium]